MHSILTGENGCMAIAVSVVRGFLDYDTPYPEGVPLPSKTGMLDTLIIKHAPDFFPRHKVRVWCEKEMYESSGSRAKYMGTNIDYEEYTSQHLFIFAYYKKGSGMNHAVIGYPVSYGDDNLIRWIISVDI